MDARLQRQPSVPPKSHRGDPPAGPERKGQPRDDVRRAAHETAAQRQRAARAEDHNIAEETNGDEATMDERDNDKESGDGAGRDENERRRHRRRLEEAFGIGDDPTRGRREGNEVAPTATRGAIPDGLALPQEAPPRNREERIRLARTEESREKVMRLLTEKKTGKRDWRSRDREADRPTGDDGAATPTEWSGGRRAVSFGPTAYRRGEGSINANPWIVLSGSPVEQLLDAKTS